MRTVLHHPFRRLLQLAFGCALAAGALAWGIRTYPELGPALANGLRSIIGVDAVSRLEERVARLDDARKRAVAPRAPRPLSAVQSVPGTAERPAVAHDAGLERRPPDAVPPFPGVAARGDGRFVAVVDPVRPESPPLLFSTLLHPDPARPWAELFVVTALVEDAELWAVAGTLEPASSRKHRHARTGLIRPEHEEKLLAAFNGGFRAEHGRFGMMVDGVELLPPRAGLCTVRGHADRHLDIVSWSQEDGAGTSELLWWRQTPPCMVENGRMHPGLGDEGTKTWGATLEGSAVIRRSAIGLSADGRRLFIAISNDTTARAIAHGMQSAGASTVAQLDVNWSYPRFLLFPRDAAGQRHAMTLFRGFTFHVDDYVRRPSSRDFFYLVRR